MSSHNDLKIAFIGAGNMASSIIGGLVNKGFDAASITASDLNPESLQTVATQFSVFTTTSNAEAVRDAQVVVLAVKPQVMGTVCTDLKPHLPQGALVISIAAGIDCRSLNAWLGESVSLVRCMPNTPSLIGEGAAGLYASSTVANTQKAHAEAILGAVGCVTWVESESLLDTVTAVSGSGPAYFFLVLEAMIDAGVAQGLTRETASTLAIQTALGAAKLAQSSDVDTAELRRRVTSPNGTTERAIACFEKNELRRIVRDAMQDCADRSRQLAEELGA